MLRECGFKIMNVKFVILFAVCIVPWISVSAQDELAVSPEQQVARPNANKSWPGFLGPNRDGRSSETGILKDWSNGKLEVAWRRKLGTGYSLGSTYQGKYFQLDAIDNECRLSCLDERSGKEIWVFNYGFQYKDMYGFDNGPRTTPLIDDGLVYIFGVAGMLHCLNVDNGKVVWKVDTKEKFGVVQNFFGVGSSPIVVGEKLVVMVGGSPAADASKNLDDVGTNGTGIVIFDKKTGEVLNRVVDDLASYASVNLYRDDGATRAVAWMREKVVGIDLEKGEQLWSFPYRARKYESVNASTPVVQGSQIFLSESYGPGAILLNVAGNTPKVLWQDKNIRNRSLATHWNTPVFHDGNIYACDGERPANSDIRCVGYETGKVKWKKSGYGRASLTFVDDHLVVLDETGSLLLIRATAEKFDLVTEYSDSAGKKLSLKRPCWAAPVISNGLLFVRGKDEMVCLKLKP